MSLPAAAETAVGDPDCSPPPGLDTSVNVAGPVNEGLSHKERDIVDSICKDLMFKTEGLLQGKVDDVLMSLAGQLRTSVEQQQEQVNTSLEAKLHAATEKVKSLEADKEQMQKSVTLLQEQLASLSAHLYSGAWSNQMQMATGGHVNAGMMGPFATRPSIFPTIPAFPAVSEPALSEWGEVSTTAPPSPSATPHPSAPPTPSRAPCGPPSSAPPPPPGLSNPSPASPMLTSSPAPWLQPPPGLTDAPPLENLVKPSAAISLSDAIDATPEKKTLAEKAHQTPESLHREAFQKMMMQSQNDAAEAAMCGRFQSPSPMSPVPRLGTPTRNGCLNLTPKRTPGRPSHGKITPGMRSPGGMVPSSPFVICESGGSVFGFTIRKADGCSLGLDIDHRNCDKYLEVTGVQPGGAMQAWNKLCVGGPAAGKAVVAGDRIVKVNNASTPQEMLQECRDQKLLKFTVQRGDVDDDFDPGSLSSWGGMTHAASSPP